MGLSKHAQKIQLWHLKQAIERAHEIYLREKDLKTKAVYKREWRGLKSKYLYLSQKAKKYGQTL